MILFQNKITGSDTQAFISSIYNYAKKLGYKPEWISGVMYTESGFNAKAVNKQEGDTSNDYTRAAYRATGLIQFMPDTSKWLGTTNQALYNMSRVQQMYYVYKYYYKWKQSGFTARSIYDLYLINFYPYAVGKPDSYILGSHKSNAKAKEIYRQNSSLDYDNDGYISVADFKAFVAKKLPGSYKFPSGGGNTLTAGFSVLGALLLGGVLVSKFFERIRDKK